MSARCQKEDSTSERHTGLKLDLQTKYFGKKCDSIKLSTEVEVTKESRVLGPQPCPPSTILCLGNMPYNTISNILFIF